MVKSYEKKKILLMAAMTAILMILASEMDFNKYLNYKWGKNEK